MACIHTHPVHVLLTHHLRPLSPLYTPVLNLSYKLGHTLRQQLLPILVIRQAQVSGGHNQLVCRAGLGCAAVVCLEAEL